MSDSRSSAGFGIPTVLFIIFLVLKLTDTIAWSWWWVASPLWIPPAIFLGVAFLALPFIIIATRKARK